MSVCVSVCLNLMQVNYCEHEGEMSLTADLIAMRHIYQHTSLLLHLGDEERPRENSIQLVIV